ncbi:MAG: hypothetical protein H0X51_00265 [Parachlamydiaceae bacterium]|nr:hypothetical protein [Parachlamydiaceae bacterium]
MRSSQQSNFFKRIFYPTTTLKNISIHLLPDEEDPNLEIYKKAATGQQVRKGR